MTRGKCVPRRPSAPRGNRNDAARELAEGTRTAPPEPTDRAPLGDIGRTDGAFAIPTDGTTTHDDLHDDRPTSPESTASRQIRRLADRQGT